MPEIAKAKEYMTIKEELKITEQMHLVVTIIVGWWKTNQLLMIISCGLWQIWLCA